MNLLLIFLKISLFLTFFQFFYFPFNFFTFFTVSYQIFTKISSKFHKITAFSILRARAHISYFRHFSSFFVIFRPKLRPYHRNLSLLYRWAPNRIVKSHFFHDKSLLKFPKNRVFFVAFYKTVKRDFQFWPSFYTLYGKY